MSGATVSRRRAGVLPVSVLLLASLLGAAMVPLGVGWVRGETLPNHLVISEVVTGGASASDELIEIHNPTAAVLPLEGLELVYVSASGLTVTRRAAWELGAYEVPPGHHVLVANEAGAYAAIADATYASGMAATGGSVALRIIGASSAIDAVGWGTAASTWLEGTPAGAPPTGSSIERLPGGAFGSTQDTDDNAVDFVERAVPDPQNHASAPTPDPETTPSNPTPVPTPTPSLSPTATPTPIPSATPLPTDGAVVVSVATARAVPDGTAVIIEATALTDASFADGGGFVADGSAGIAVLLSSGTFTRGELLRISGTVDDRFAQRTLRSDAGGITVLGTGTEPAPTTVATGAVGEATESSLVRISGAILGAPTQLSAGLAFEVDDGSGPIRVLVATATGIDTTDWTTGASVEVVGVVGQRDSSGTGTAGYRVQPRDVADVLSVTPAATPDPSATADPDPDASPTPAPDGVARIADVRALAKNARATVRGTVTLASGAIDAGSAVIQDASGAILLRLGDEVGALTLGEQVEVSGARSTFQGMETLRVTAAARRLGTTQQPNAATVRTGDATEALEARLVTTRGALVANARRAGSGSVSFDLDDGSGPLRVYLAAALGGETSQLQAGAWVEVTGVLGQETTGALASRGYRIWPRNLAEVRVSAPATEAGDGDATGGGGGSTAGGGTGAVPDLDGLDAPNLAAAEVGATLVSAPWPELGIGGLLWDGDRLVALDQASEPGVRSLVASAGGPPVALELRNLAVSGTVPAIGVPRLRLGTDPGDAVAREAPLHAPSADLPRHDAAWVSIVGRLTTGNAPRLLIGADSPSPAIEIRCEEASAPERGLVQVTGIGLSGPPRILVPCGGIRPAPTLANGIGGATSTGGDGPVAGERMAASASPDVIPRMAAAGLLGVGALIVLLGGWIVRRLDGGGAESGHAGDESDEVEAPDAHQPLPVPAPLTLVAVPRERGSP